MPSLTLSPRVLCREMEWGKMGIRSAWVCDAQGRAGSERALRALQVGSEFVPLTGIVVMGRMRAVPS